MKQLDPTCVHCGGIRGRVHLVDASCEKADPVNPPYWEFWLCLTCRETTPLLEARHFTLAFNYRWKPTYDT